MLLTILIPTRNRAARLRPLVGSLLANLPPARRDQIEIVVLDNCSEEPATVVLASVACDALRIITNDRLEPTSEENVVNGIRHARGEYVWFLGDDDLPRYGAVGEMVELVAAGAADLFISNFRVIDGDGRLASLSQIRGAPSDLTAPLVSIIKRIGIINVLSGWSIIVARRELLDVAVARAIMASGVIYSHCFWFLECFADKRARFLTKPLVDYRVFHHAEGWHRYTDERDVGYLHYWHLGLIRHYARAMTRGLLTARDVAETFEYRHNGTRYRAIDEIVYKLIEQADIYGQTGRRRDLLTPEELREATDWLLAVDLSLQDLLVQIEAMYEALRQGPDEIAAAQAARALRGDALELIAARDQDLFAPFFVAFVYGYSVYRYADAWIAIRADAMNLVDAVFAQFEPRAMPPGVVVAPTERDLHLALRRSPPIPEPVGERPALVSMALLDSVRSTIGGGVSRDLLAQQLLQAADRDAAAAGQGSVRHLWIAEAAGQVSRDVTLASGWSPPESAGIWSIGERSMIAATLPPVVDLCLEVHAFAPAGQRRFLLSVDGGPAAAHLLDGERRILRLPAPAGGGLMTVQIAGDPVGTPANHRLSADTRQLGLFVHRIWTEDRPPARRRPTIARYRGWLRRRWRRVFDSVGRRGQ